MRTKQQAMKRRRTKGLAYAALLAGLGLAALLALALAPGAGSGSAPGYAAGTAAFAAGGNTFVSAASTSIGLRSAALEPLDELTPGFGRPAAAGGEGGAAAWDIGGSELVYAAPGGEAGTLGVTGSLVSADVNAAGYVAAVSLTEEELGLVTVFSPEGAADAGAEPDVLPAAEEDAPPPQAVSAETASARERIKASAFFISDLLMKHYFRTGRTTGQPGPYMASIPGVHTGLF